MYPWSDPLYIGSMITIDRWFRNVSKEDGLVHGLCGVVMGHPNIEDGIRTRTSDVVAKIHGAKYDYIVTENGTLYRLLEPKPEYEARFPNARARLLKLLPDADDVQPPAEDQVDVDVSDYGEKEYE